MWEWECSSIHSYRRYYMYVSGQFKPRALYSGAKEPLAPHQRAANIARAERDGTSAETRFRLSPKRTNPFKSVGVSVQSTAGSFSNARYITFGGGVRVLATHSIRQFPLHFPSRASLCATRFRTSSTTESLWVFKEK